MHHKDLNIADIRKDYRHAHLDENNIGDDPMAFFAKWFAEAKDAQIDEVNAMALSTVDADSKPHTRIVLLKGLNDKGFVFFTNYDSAKGHQIKENPHAALLFFWKELERQVRIEGVIEKLPAAESDTYFNSRPHGSKIGAWASPQSQIIPDRSVLHTKEKSFEEEFKDKAIPRPSHWGGYCLVPHAIEFWQGRSNRLHDRIFYTLNVEKKWQKWRLAP